MSECMILVAQRRVSDRGCGGAYLFPGWEVLGELKQEPDVGLATQV